jgi:hypothetical protein
MFELIGETHTLFKKWKDTHLTVLAIKSNSNKPKVNGRFVQDLQTSVELKKYKQSMRRILGYNHNHHWQGLSLTEALMIFS